MSLLLHEVLSRFADSDAIAVVCGARVVRYRELSALSSRIAAALHARKRPGERPLVGVSAAVTVESIAAILGVLKAGLAYVPLDVRSPPDRLARILSQAQIPALLLDPRAHEVELLCQVPGVVWSASLSPGHDRGEGSLSWEQLTDREPLDTPVPVLADDLAYVLYTSGSTGTPKGVMLTHRNARTFTDWMCKEFQVTAVDRLMSRSPLNFDLSVFDIFCALSAGAIVIVHTPQAAQDPEARHRAYVEDMRRHGATVLYTTPSTFTTLLDKGGLDASVPLRLMLYAGEPFRPKLLRALMLAMPGVAVANIYGPTETNIVTCYRLPCPPEGNEPIPIGVEVDDTEIVIVSDLGARCGSGERGEIWVRGGTVCLGYLGMEALTAERLVRSPFHAFPAQFWRTGDHGYRRQDGVIVYQGRLDDMVKVKGYRIELGEVEMALCALPGVSLSVVLPLPHDRYGSTLTALVVPKPGARLEEGTLRAMLGETLPEYMVPAQIELRQELPFTSTGKIDRQLLISEQIGRNTRAEETTQT